MERLLSVCNVIVIKHFVIVDHEIDKNHIKLIVIIELCYTHMVYLSLIRVIGF